MRRGGPMGELGFPVLLAAMGVATVLGVAHLLALSARRRGR